ALPIPRTTPAREYIGLGMRFPVYRNGLPVDTVEQRRAAYLGSVGAGFNVENLLTSVLDEKTMRYMRFRVYGPSLDQRAPTSPGKERLLFDSNQLVHGWHAQSAADDPSLTLTDVMPMKIYGR